MFVGGILPRMTMKQIWLIAGTVTAAFAVLCCAAAVASSIWLFSKSPQDAVEDYLSALQSNDDSAARAQLCDAWRDNPLGNLVDVSAWTSVVDYDVIDSEVHDKSATVDARVTYAVLTVTGSRDVRFTLVREDDDWKICGIRNRP